jgi:glycosyltransferase involved in cell wall biosynthesis
MLSAHALGVKSLKKDIFIGLAKILGFYNRVVFHATSKEEALAIQQLLGNKTKVSIAPNLPRKAPKLFLSREKNPGQITLASVARISPEKNTLFAIEVIRKYASKHLTQSSDNKYLEKVYLNFDLYGPVYDQQYWEQCQKVIKSLPSQVRVNYRGSIAPEKSSDIFENAHFLLMPSQGENFGHTILESLQHGCPVIISDRTPWRGLQHIDAVNGSVGWDLSLEQPDKFTEVLESCISMNQEEYSAMSLRAYTYAKAITEDIEVVEANRRLFEEKV